MRKSKNKILIVSIDLILCERIRELALLLPLNIEFYISSITNIQDVLFDNQFELIIFDIDESIDLLENIFTSKLVEKYSTPIVFLLNNLDDESYLNQNYEISDYILKSNLNRLKLIIPREIKYSKLLKENKIIISEIEKDNSLLYNNNSTSFNSSEIALNFDFKDLFDRLFHTFPIGIALINAKTGVVNNINQAYLEIIEYSRNEVIGKNALYLNVWKYKGERDTLIDFIIKFGSVKNLEEIFITKSNKEKNILLSAIYLPHQIIEESTFMFIAIDISERKKLEQDIYHSLENEKNLSILKTRFISMISHEFRTPLTTIMLSTDILRTYSENWSREEKEKHYSRIQTTILNLIQLLENVIIISRIDTNEFDVHYEDLDLKSFFIAVIETTINNLNSNATYDIKLEGDFKNLMIDENLTSLILNNLITNSIKYSERSPKIEFYAYSDKLSKRLTISIKDYGIGIPEEDIHNVVESFYRAANVGNKSGFGLGLSIVKKCLEKLHGKLKIESELNSYTKVSLILPLIEYKK